MERDYKLEKEEYYETIWYIRQYPKFLKDRDSILNSRRQNYGIPRGSEVGDPTAMTVIRLEKVEAKIAPIKEALSLIPQEYQNGIIENIVKHTPYPDYADTSTWKRWRRRFVYYVAMERRQ